MLARLRFRHFCFWNALLLVSWLPSLALAQRPLTKNTLRLEESSSLPKGSVDQLDWLHGFWRGQGLGGDIDEAWDVPAAGTIYGSFRYIRNGEVQMTEFMEVSQVAGSLLLKVKHFDRQLKGWEEKDKAEAFRLVKLEDKAVYFDGLTYRLDRNGDLLAFVAQDSKEGSPSELSFRFQPAPSKSERLDDRAVGNEERKFRDLPKDSIVFQLDQKGGFRMPFPNGFTPSPVFALYGSGKVVFGSKSPKVEPMETDLGVDFVEEFMGFVMDESRFVQITTEDLKTQIEGAEQTIQVADAPTTEVMINLPEKQHRVELYGLSFAAEQHPTIEGVQTLDRIQKRCNFLRNRHVLQKHGNVREILAEVNRVAKVEHPDVQAITISNLQYAFFNARGVLSASFVVEYERQNAKTLSCAVEVKGGKITVRCY